MACNRILPSKSSFSTRPIAQNLIERVLQVMYEKLSGRIVDKKKIRTENYASYTPQAYLVNMVLNRGINLILYHAANEAAKQHCATLLAETTMSVYHVHIPYDLCLVFSNMPNYNTPMLHPDFSIALKNINSYLEQQIKIESDAHYTAALAHLSSNSSSLFYLLPTDNAKMTLSYLVHPSSLIASKSLVLILTDNIFKYLFKKIQKVNDCLELSSLFSTTTFDKPREFFAELCEKNVSWALYNDLSDAAKDQVAEIIAEDIIKTHGAMIKCYSLKTRSGEKNIVEFTDNFKNEVFDHAFKLAFDKMNPMAIHPTK